jgi:rhodanese-related sulfurtransferase
MNKSLGDFVREARARIREWDAETAHEQLEAGGVQVIDVREAGEYAAGHLPGAIHIPRGLLEAAADPHNKHRDERLCRAREQPLLLYCQSGGRSAMACATLLDMGFSHAVSLAGGLDVWAAEDYPVVSA